jgi:2-haloacid dehalogenase
LENNFDISVTRRQILGSLAAVPLAGQAMASGTPKLRALAFDAFVLFDPAEIVRRATSVAGRDGAALINAASARLFAYTWYYTSASRYRPLDALARDAFAAAAESLVLPLEPASLDHLVEGYSQLATWPDVGPALDRLRQAGIRLAVLSNLPAAALRSNLEKGGIDRHFEFVLSTDRVRQYKPAPRAYRLGTDAFHVTRTSIGFAASASWDASGATWFGYPTAWINRAGAPRDPAHAEASVVSSDMTGVLRLARASG